MSDTTLSGRPCTYENVEGKACRDPSSAAYLDATGSRFKYRCPGHEDTFCTQCGHLADRDCPAFMPDVEVIHKDNHERCGRPLCGGCQHRPGTNVHMSGPRSNVPFIKTTDLPPIGEPVPESDAIAEVEPKPIEVGEWVLIWAQVTKTPDMDGVHPDDTEVRAWSHNADVLLRVRNDRIVSQLTPPEFAMRCNALATTDENNYARCQRLHSHDGEHKVMGGLHWKDFDEGSSYGEFDD